MHSILRIDFAEHVDMIGHHLHFEDFGAMLFGGIEDNPFQPLVDAIYQHGAAVFRAPDDVIFARINHVVVALVLHWLYYAASGCLLQAKSLAAEAANLLISPCLKAGALRRSQ
jgi:hypothetical protein